MIFLTVGTHEPFDRLVRCVDDWCAQSGQGDQVLGQITKRADYHPTRFKSVPALDPGAYRDQFAAADFIISHAGMGSIITALSLKKPIVILPRRGHLRETRNDHQFATMQRFRSRPGIWAAADEAELSEVLTQLTDAKATVDQEISPFADAQLIATLRDFIHGSAQTR